MLKVATSNSEKISLDGLFELSLSELSDNALEINDRLYSVKVEKFENSTML